MIRSYQRSLINRPCLLTNNKIKVTVKACDISEGGLGIEVDAGVPIAKNEEVNILMEDFDINSAAQIVWINKEGDTLRAGLQFL